MPSIRAKDEIAIHVDPDVVFGVVSDYINITTWLPVYTCRYLNGRDVVEGLKVCHQYGKPPFVMSRFTRIINKVVPGRRLEETYVDGDLRGTGIWSFEKTDHGTLASYECDVTSQTWLPHIMFMLFGAGAHTNVSYCQNLCFALELGGELVNCFHLRAVSIQFGILAKLCIGCIP
ncbi:Uncharacterised protein [Halioglobus japonicus]|nr:Uncharacterised protein [Halioglobus japonicus]